MLPIANQTTGPIGTLTVGRSVIKAKNSKFFFNFFFHGQQLVNYIFLNQIFVANFLQLPFYIIFISNKLFQISSLQVSMLCVCCVKACIVIKMEIESRLHCYDMYEDDYILQNYRNMSGQTALHLSTIGVEFSVPEVGLYVFIST